MLRVAKILKSNGTDGGLLVGACDIDLNEFDFKEPVFVEFDGLAVPFFIESLLPKGQSKAIIRLSDVSSLSDAEELVGRFLCTEGEEEEDTEEDFTGWNIYDKDRFVGIASGMQEFPGHVCVCIGDVLLPLHEDLVLGCSPDSRTLVLDLPEGLIGD